MAEKLVAAVAPVEAIVRLAQRVPVFPCRRHAEEVTIDGRTRLLKPKSPLTRRGFIDATQDANQIRAWWRRWPDALVGVPMGQRTGLLAVDYDTHKADASAQEWVSAHTDWLLQTRVHSTLSGGRHYLYRLPPGAEYASGVNITLGGGARKGIDLRAEGGYIIWWPIHGGQATGEAAALPAGLVDERRIEARELPPLPPSSSAKWSRDRLEVASALAWLDPSSYDTWRMVGMAVHLASGGSDDGFALWHAWSAGEVTGELPANYAGVNDCRYHWSSYTHDKDRGRLVTLGSVFKAASAAGWAPKRVLPDSEPPPIEAPPIDAYETDALLVRATAADVVPVEQLSEPEPARISLDLRLDWANLQTREPPERQWIVRQWLGMGHVTLLAGPPGSGKTAVAQAIASAVSQGVDLIDHVPQPRRVLFWAGEDDQNELWRRQIAIAKLMQVPLDSFAGKLEILPLAAEDITLYAETRDGAVPTPQLKILREQIGDLKAEFVVLDSVARTYGASENDRHDVTGFIAALNRACEPTGAGLCLIGHPAKAQGSEFSGSTAWEASVRSRLYFGFQMPDAPPDPDAVQDPASPVRFLAKRKTNYSTRDWREVRYTDGVMVPQTPDAGRAGSSRGPGLSVEFLAEEAVRVLRKLRSMGITVSHSSQASNYLPKAAKAAGLLTAAVGERELKTGLAEAFKGGLLKVAPVGLYPNRTPKMGLVEANL